MVAAKMIGFPGPMAERRESGPQETTRVGPKIMTATTPGSQPGRAPDEGSLDFEPTDLESARRALDDAVTDIVNQAAFGADPSVWVRRRRPPRAEDRALTGPALQWMSRLPEALRPHGLAKQHPRLVNQIALAWPDHDGCREVLNKLLTDERGHRRGFPAELRTEVAALRDHLG